MKSDNSRITFDPRKHYSGVREQQGRVQIDADANEQSDIVNYRIEMEAGDVIGLCGAPMHYPAFHVVGDLAGLSTEERALLGNTRPETGTAKIPTGFKFPDFLISAGRYYVDGILCENEQLISYLTQPDLPNAPPIDQPGLYVVYVDVWQRLLTALDDPSIREVALGGPDTATRTKTVWQVKHWLAVDRSNNKLEDGNCLSTFNVFEDLIAPSSGKLSARSKRAETTTDPCVVSPVAGYTGLENQLYRIEIHDAGAVIDATTAASTRMTPVANETAQIKASGNWTRQTPIEIFSAADPMGGKLAFVQTVDGPRRGAKTLTLNIDVSQIPFSDPLVREVGATFKWSRDNGVVVTAIQSMSGAEVTVHDLGPDDTLGFKEGQWVEVSDDALELSGLPGQLAQISKVDSALKRITLKTAVDPLDASDNDGVNKDLHPKLRRWDGVGVVKFDPEAEDNFLNLESGVQISFSAGTLRTGDYWTVPARTATADTQAGNIDWPVDGSNRPLQQSPFGIKHHYCRLAMVKWDGRNFTFEDCRSLFPPITELTSMVYVSGDGQEALPGQQIQQPLQVGVFNGRWPVENARVQFRISSAAGRFAVRSTDPDLDQGQLKSIDGRTGPATTITVRTGADGIAGCVWLLDPRIGPLVDPTSDRSSQQVEARLLDATGAPTPALVRFDGNLSIADEVAYFPGDCAVLNGDTTVQRALDRLSHLVSLYEVSGNNQEVMPSEVKNLAPLEVLAANRCGPVVGQKVSFSVISGTGTVTPETVDTSGRGIARCTWQLDPATPRQEVEARLSGAGPFAAATTVRFVANLSTAAQVAYDPGDCALLKDRGTVQTAIDQLSKLISLYEVSGNNQIAAIGETQEVRVLAANKCGPVKNQKVSFTVLGAGGGIVPAEALTDDQGNAAAIWTFSDAKSQQVRATLVETAPRSLAVPTSVLFNANRRATGASQGVGCEITVGSGGQFERLDEAITNLLSDEDLIDICLCLLPGDHLTGGLNITRDGLHLKITGCGRGSRLQFTETGDSLPSGTSTVVQGLASFTLRDLEVFGENYFLSFDHCEDVTFAHCYVTQENVSGEGQIAPLINIAHAKQVRLEGNVVSATLPMNPTKSMPTRIFREASEELSLLFTIQRRADFAESAKELAAGLASRPLNFRVDLARLITQSLQTHGRGITDDEVRSYNEFIAALESEDRLGGLAERLLATLTAIRLTTLAASPGVAIVLADAEAETRLEDNEITGVVSLYGPPAQTTLKEQELRALLGPLRRGDVAFTESLANLRVRNNALYRISVSEATVASLRITTDTKQSLTGFYRRCFVTDNAFTGGDSLLVAEHLALSSDTFEQDGTLNAGAVVASAATYVGNFAPSNIKLFDTTAVSEKNANAVIRIVAPGS